MRLDFQIGDYSSKGKLTVRTYEPEPLEYQEHFLEVPGRDGAIDFTDAYGKTSYKDREWRIFAHIRGSLESRQQTLSELLSAVEGKRLECRFTTDPDHVLEGRWTVEYIELGSKTEIEIVGRCNPFRYRDTFTATINAVGGVFMNLPSGDKPVCPIIEVNRRSEIAFNGQTYFLEAGAYRVRDIWFTAGNNVLYVDTYPEADGNMLWSDYEGMTWDQLKDKTWSELKWGDAPPQLPYTWADYSEITWSELSSKRWMELVNPAEPGDEYAVYVQYERSDF